MTTRLLTFYPTKKRCTKALQCIRLRGSFTVEAAFAVPLFLFAAVVFLGLFSMLQVQIQVAGGLQYASRTLAASWGTASEGDSAVSVLAGRAEGRVLFLKYLREHDFDGETVKGGLAGISLARSDFSGEYVTLQAEYRVRLPVSFWMLRDLPVSQCVSCRKWIGFVPDGVSGEEDGYVYVTKRGSAYHKSTACRYLDLTVHSISADEVAKARNKDGGKYYRCGCCRSGQSTVYVTDYGIQYHGNINCRDLKRTVYKIRKEEVGMRHPCQKCYGGVP